jgi:N4-gp56 family major capsid protein
MATVTWGNQGQGLGVKQQAYLDKLMTAELAQRLIFDRFATIEKALPQNNGKTIEFKKWVPMRDLMIANKIYKDYTENQEGEGIAVLVDKGAYNNIVLPEGSSGTEQGQMKKISFTTDVFPIGMWMSVTEETSLFDDMYTIKENIRQYSETASMYIDAFYRDTYINSAGHQIDITGNADPDDKVTSEAFFNAVRKISLQLRLSGAKYVNTVLSASPNVGTVPVWSRYIGIVNIMMGEAIRNNPKFKPLEQYATGNVKPLDGEIGMINDIRIIENENMLIEDAGNGTYTGYMLVLGKDHTANIPLRGKKRIEVIVKGLNGGDKSDPLNRTQTIGWKSWLGAYTLYPERLGLIKAHF